MGCFLQFTGDKRLFPPVSWSWGMRISHPVGYLVHLPFLCFPFPSKVFPKGEAKALNFVRYQTGFSVLTHLYKHRLHLCSDFFLGRDFLPLFAHLKHLQAAKYLSHSLSLTEQAYSIPVSMVLVGFPLLLEANQVPSHPSRITATWRRRAREAERTFRQGKGFLQESIMMM